MARARIRRDGVTQFAAVNSSGRQLRLLRELRDRLAGDPALDVFYGDHLDGATYLTVYPAGDRSAAGIMGEPNGVESPEDYWAAPETS